MSLGDRSIFVTLGTHGQSFPRALTLVGELTRHGSVRVQHGETAADHGLARVDWVRYLELPQMQAAMQAADVVICHAGVGSTISALRAGKLPILLPRLRSHNEHVDDHQLQLAGRFAETGLALVYDGCEPVADLLERAAVGVPDGIVFGEARLRSAVARAAGLGVWPPDADRAWGS